MEICTDTLKVFQHKDLLDYITQILTALGTSGATIISLMSTVLSKREKIEGEFTFYTERNLVCLGLRNLSKNVVYFNPQQGVCIMWKDKEKIKYHKINLPENSTASFIPPKGSAQLNYEIKFNRTEKAIINSRQFRVFIYTTRNKRFELNPTERAQLKKLWQGMTIDQWKKDVENNLREVSWIGRQIRKLKFWKKK